MARGYLPHSWMKTFYIVCPTKPTIPVHRGTVIPLLPTNCAKCYSTFKPLLNLFALFKMPSQPLIPLPISNQSCRAKFKCHVLHKPSSNPSSWHQSASLHIPVIPFTFPSFPSQCTILQSRDYIWLILLFYLISSMVRKKVIAKSSCSINNY